MKAIVCKEFGPIDNLTVENISTPLIKDHEVLIDVAYATINYPDALIVQGLYQVKPQTPFTPGHDCSGVVKQVGKGVPPHIKAGDRVYVSTNIGTFAERIAVDWFKVRPAPAGVSLEIAACLGVAYATSYHALYDSAKLQAGETVLVLGAAGGVGSAAVEIALAMGAKVIAAASTEEKCIACLKLGAHHAINYTDSDLKTVLKTIAPTGVDVVYDPVGGLYSEPAFRSLGYRGRHLVVGFANGAIPSIPLNLALLTERSVMGVYVGAWAQRKPDEVQAVIRQVNKWASSGVINPTITKKFTLEQVPEALQLAQTRQLIGKAVIEINAAL